MLDKVRSGTTSHVILKYLELLLNFRKAILKIAWSTLTSNGIATSDEIFFWLSLIQTARTDSVATPEGGGRNSGGGARARAAQSRSSFLCQFAPCNDRLLIFDSGEWAKHIRCLHWIGRQPLWTYKVESIFAAKYGVMTPTNPEFFKHRTHAHIWDLNSAYLPEKEVEG